MRVVWMENELIKVGILVDRGSDIFEFRAKKQDVNVLLRLPKGILNPNQIQSQIRDTPNQMEDYYYGGWQECLPNSAPLNYRGAHLGQHGEVWMIPWQHAIIENSAEKIALKVWTRPLRFPIMIEKVLTLERGSSALTIDVKITNESETILDLMWGQHIAFGLPWLEDGAKVITNAQDFYAEPKMPDSRRFKPGVHGQWPDVMGVDGAMVSADLIPPLSVAPYSDLAYLSGFSEWAYYALQTDQLGFAVTWDPTIFTHLWYWQERFASQDAPWWGSTYAVGLEPWTSPYFADPEKAVVDDKLFKIDPGEIISTKLSASIFEDDFEIPADF